jgi:lysophospholipid acyltransferase (LPLAT)-like uncharacterized protein
MRFPVPPALVRWGATPLVKALSRSWRFTTHRADRWEPIVARGDAYIFLLWHEAIVPLLWFHRHRGIAIIVSQGREGRYVGDYASGLGYRILSGSSSRGGPRALLGAVRVLAEGGAVAITPDGPKGPRREVKPGVVQAARRSGAWIIPLHATAHPAWRVGSWDRLAIPKPRARVTVGFGEPFRLTEPVQGIEADIARSEAALATLEAEMRP